MSTQPALITAGIIVVGILVLALWYTTSHMGSDTINPDAIGRGGYPQIFEAIEDANHERVARIIAYGADIFDYE